MPLLVIDADGTCRAVFEQVVSAVADVRAVATVQEVTSATAGGWRPRAVVIDPHLDGQVRLDMIAALRDHEPLADVPLVVLTREVTDEVEAAATVHGASGVVRKPCDPLTLDEHLRRFAVAA